ncbi:MAG: exodeoxyribonuclease VII large subunit [Candidatus Sericytochromatia bacterium]|nr:exodeoxyribonuclease VII large subunit [Candidatus Sericytochromatia bacterium]
MGTHAGANGTLDWDEARGCLTVAIKGPDFHKVLSTVKGLPSSAFDSGRKVWTLPAGQVDIYLEVLEPLGVGISPKLRGWLERRTTDNPAGPGRARPERAIAAERPAVPEARPVAEQAETGQVTTGDLTVADVLGRARAAIAAAFGSRNFWVTAIVREWKSHPATRHIFIKLVDDPASSGGDELSAVIWANRVPAIRKAYADRDIVIARDDRVRLKCSVTLSRGQLSLVVEEVDPAATESGDRIREMRLRMLQERGLADRNKVLRLPALPLVVGIVSSRGADGYEDFTKVLRDSGLPFTLILHQAAVQGENAEIEVPVAIRALGQAAVDVVVVIRGGGSPTQLSCFNAIAIGEAIALCPIPVLTGIGHEPDLHLADLVAAKACKTPTDAANQLVQTVEKTTRVVVTRARQRLTRARELAQQHRHQTQQVRQRLAFALSRIIDRQRQRLDGLRPASALKHLLEREHTRLEALAARQKSADPDRPLRLGYVRILTSDGRPAGRVARLHTDQAVVLQLTDGRAEARITRTIPDGELP